MELMVRFLVGGLVVSLFASLADALKPKSFAGILSAAPSVALATLGMTVLKDGKTYAATEAQSMILGAAAFLLYTLLVSTLLRQGKRSVLLTATFSLLLWFSGAFGLWFVILR